MLSICSCFESLQSYRPSRLRSGHRIRTLGPERGPPTPQYGSRGPWSVLTDSVLLFFCVFFFAEFIFNSDTFLTLKLCGASVPAWFHQQERPWRRPCPPGRTPRPLQARSCPRAAEADPGATVYAPAQGHPSSPGASSVEGCPGPGLRGGQRAQEAQADPPAPPPSCPGVHQACHSNSVPSVSRGPRTSYGSSSFSSQCNPHQGTIVPLEEGALARSFLKSPFSAIHILWYVGDVRTCAQTTRTSLPRESRGRPVR